MVLLVVVVAVSSKPGLDKTSAQLIREAAETFLKREHNQQEEKTVAKLTGSKVVRGMKTPTRRTQRLLDQQEKRRVELEALALMAAKGDVEMVRTLENEQVALFARADEDPICSMTINCSDTTNRNIVDNLEFRSVDGICNNMNNFEWGMAGVQHLREVSDAYRNGRWNPRDESVTGTRREPVDLPNARTISEAVHKPGDSGVADSASFTLALFQWGQFVDHDIISTPEGNLPTGWDCCEDSSRGFCMPLFFPDGDSYFEEQDCMDPVRSFTVLRCNDTSGFQNQINEVTAFVDASNVYGSEEEQTNELRTFIGGFLKTGTSNMLPENNEDDENCDEDGMSEENAYCFEAGDSRVNVFPGLSTFHTLFMREHNRIARALGVENEDWSDERLFQETRKILAAIMQKITYSEFLPALLSADQLDKWGVSTDYTYDSQLDASIIQSFSIAFRFHNLMPSSIHLARASGDSVTNHNSYSLDDIWLDPSLLFKHSYRGVDELTLGLALNSCPHASRFMADSSRNKLFIDANGESYDLAARNILRGREWGTPSYTVFRSEVCGFNDVTSWDDLTDHSAEAIAALQSVYLDPRDIDLWTGVVSETLVGSSLAGPTQSCLVARQFANLKHGDRFWYETSDSNIGFRKAQLAEINKVSLARVMCDNMDIASIREEVFKVTSAFVDCSSLPEMDLSVWGAARK